MVFLVEIPRKNSFEGEETFGLLENEGKMIPDKVQEDSALACRTKEGLVIITGCSHSGICNIIEYTKIVCPHEKIVDIVGGLHLQNSSQERLQKTTDYLSQLNLKQLHA